VSIQDTKLRQQQNHHDTVPRKKNCPAPKDSGRKILPNNQWGKSARRSRLLDFVVDDGDNGVISVVAIEFLD
jgi:hypothetical protein